MLVLRAMKREISQKEREEFVTRGFLIDQKYLTLKTLEEIMDPKNRVTKESLEKRLELLSSDFRQHLETLMEHQMNQLQILMEQMDDRYVLRREWNSARGV